MPEGYCVKCKAKKEIADAVEEVMKNGRKAIKGRCPTCGVVMFKILGGKAVVPSPASPASETEASASAPPPSATTSAIPLTPSTQPAAAPAPASRPNSTP